MVRRGANGLRGALKTIPSLKGSYNVSMPRKTCVYKGLKIIGRVQGVGKRTNAMPLLKKTSANRKHRDSPWRQKFPRAPRLRKNRKKPWGVDALARKLSNPRAEYSLALRLLTPNDAQKKEGKNKPEAATFTYRLPSPQWLLKF